MILLHTGLADDTFPDAGLPHDATLHVWGETQGAADPGAAPEEPPPSPPGRRRPEGAMPPRYPHDAGGEDLAAALASFPGGFLPDESRIETLTAWLPTRGRRPVPSSPLVGDPPPRRGRLALRPWSVTAVGLDREETLTLLASLVGTRSPGPGMAVAPDLAFWIRVLRFAGSLVARQRVLPAVVCESRPESPIHRARWTPVLEGPDLEEAQRLARSMPGAARALRRRGSRTPPARPGAEAVRAFLAAMVDHLVRSAQWEDFLLPCLAPENGDGPGHAREPAHSVDDQWLQSLRAPDPTLIGAPDELRDFARRVSEWRRPLDAAVRVPYRLCLRLEEPECEPPPGTGPAGDGSAAADASGAAHGRRAGPWRLRFLAQAKEEPSLLMPLDRIWRPGTPERATFDRYGPPPRDYILEALGRAGRVSAAVEGSLSDREPVGREFDTAGAYRFLCDEAPALREAGFGVLVPTWWGGGGARERPRLQARIDSPDMQARGGLSLDQLVRVRWDVVVGGETLGMDELEALAALKAPLVRLRGRWVELDAAALAGTLRDLERRGADRLTARDAVRLALGAAPGPDGADVAGVEATGWFRDVLERLDDTGVLEVLDPPAGVRASLRPYQLRGFTWLAYLSRWGLGACLADDMGLGKTIQALALTAHGSEAGDGGPVLVVCPTSVANNWRREAERFTPALRVVMHHGPERPRGDDLREAVAGRDLVITTYPLLARDREALASLEWRGVILDEAQNIKNPDTKQARAARALDAGFRVALTGTPVENHVGELWSMMEFLNAGLLGSRAEFKRRFFLPIQTSRDPDALRRLRRATGPFILRRVKTDRSVIADLPEKLEMKSLCTLTREQATLYAAVLREAESALEGEDDGIGRKGRILATLTRLKQVCNHPAHLLGDGSPIPGRSGKVERLGEMLGEVLEARERALVFTQFARMGEILRRHLQDTFVREVLFLHGGVPKRRRDEMVRRFQEEGDGPDIFVLSLKAGGTGLNLTAANHVFHFDRWWNPAVETQATDRAFRIGQTRDVQVHKLLCAGTLEERIDEIIEAKGELAREVVGAGEAWLTELSNADLGKILALDPEAVGD